MSHVAFFLNIMQILIARFVWIHSNMLGIVNIKAIYFKYVNEPTHIFLAIYSTISYPLYMFWTIELFLIRRLS